MWLSKFIVFTLSFLLCTSSKTNGLQLSSKKLLELVDTNFLIGISSLGAYLGNSTQCGNELEILLKATANQDLWTLKLLDSFGLPPHQFIWGNYFWLGSKDMCQDLNNPYKISLGKQQTLMTQQIFNVTSPFPVRYLVVYLNFTTPYYIDVQLPFENYINLGLCMPRSCSLQYIEKLVIDYFQRQQFDILRNFQLELKEVIDMKVPHFSWHYFTQTGSILFLCIFFTVIIIVILAEYIHRSKKDRICRQFSDYQLNLNKATSDLTIEQDNNVQVSKCLELLLCFHLTSNIQRLMKNWNTTQISSHTKFFPAMTGLRTIICLWITVFHVYYYSLYSMSNTPLIIAKLEYFLLQPVIQSCFYVDVFFIMSSFLLVYNFLSNTIQIEQFSRNTLWQNTRSFATMVLQRYIRLTPVMLITTLLSFMIYDLLDMYSPFRLGQNSGVYCKSNWWYNIFYIQNLLNMNSICCSWTWYLACEMQYFILFTSLLFIYVRHPRIVKWIFVGLAFCSVIFSWFCNYNNDITFQIDRIYSTLDQLYVKPWVRIIPYVGGAAMGWLMYYIENSSLMKNKKLCRPECQVNLQSCENPSRNIQNEITQQTHQPQNQHSIEEQQQQGLTYQNQTSNLQQRHHWLCWFLIGRKIFWLFLVIIYVTTNFMSYWRATPSWLVATIMSIGKLTFALTIGGFVILCSYGYGHRLNAFLSAPLFIFLSQFCFSIYMLAPLIVIAMFGLRNEPTKFTEVGSGADFIAVIVTAFISAFLMVLLIEMPMQRIACILFQKKTKQKDDITTINK